MKEKRTQVRTYIIEAECDEPGCGGVLEHTSTREGGGEPVAHRHVCGECGGAESLGTIYPLLKYEPESLVVKL